MIPLTFEEQIEFLTTPWTSKTLKEFFKRVESKFTKQEIENFKSDTFNMIFEGLKKVYENQKTQEPRLESDDIVKEWLQSTVTPKIDITRKGDTADENV